MGRARKKTTLTDDERFHHRLTIALGYHSVEHMLSCLSDAALERWRLFDILEPIGPRESRMHLAQLLATLLNHWRDVKKTPPMKATDFLIRLRSEVEAEESAEIQQKKQTLFDTLMALARPRSKKKRRK